MRLENLHLENFRTYTKVDIEFPSRLTFLTGDNAIGKTNILEAISLLSLGKSFRSTDEENLVSKDSETFFLAAKFHNKGITNTIEYGYEKPSGKRRIKIAGKALRSRSAIIGNLNTVILAPHDLVIVEGGSAHRRRFLDIAICNYDADYLKQLLLYNRTLKQRNQILKKIKERRASIPDLKIWNQSLSVYASSITKKRVDFVNSFQEHIQHAVSEISGERDDVTLAIGHHNHFDANEYLRTLEISQSRDLVLGYTTEGPHRHAILFRRDDQDIIHFGSQGQKRTLVLALRVAEFRFLSKILGEAPLLLIDDVIRELDKKRRAAFVQLLHSCGQAIFTTPDLDGLESMLESVASETMVYKIYEKGFIRKES